MPNSTPTASSFIFQDLSEFTKAKIPALPSKKVFQNWVTITLEKALAQNKKLHITLLSIKDMIELNQSFRNKNYPTNVLSFPLAQPQDFTAVHQEADFLGDIFICPSIVLQESEEQNKRFDHHMAHMTIHGTLHLLGYDHEKSPEEATKMERLEIKILAEFKIPNPYD